MLYLVLGLVLAAFGLLIAALATANTLFAWLSVTVSVVAAGLLVFDWLSGRRRARESAEKAEPEPVSARQKQPLADQSPPLTDTVRGDSAEEEPAAQEPARAATSWVERARQARAEPTTFVTDSEPAATPTDTGVRSTGTEPRHAGEPVTQEPASAEHAQPDEPGREPESEPGEPDVPYKRLAAGQPREPVAEEQGEPDEEQTDASDLLVVSDLRAEVRVIDEHPRYHLTSCRYLLGKPTIPLPVSEARQLGFTPCVRCGPDATLAAQHRAMR